MDWKKFAYEVIKIESLATTKRIHVRILKFEVKGRLLDQSAICLYS